MQTQFLYHLLGVCLLLIQLPGEVPGRKVTKSVKVCGRAYTRLHNEVCSSANSRKNRTDSNHPHHHPETSSSTNDNAEDLHINLESGNMLPENQPLRMEKKPGLQDAKLNSAELKKINLKKLNKAKHNKNITLLVPNNLAFNKHSQKKKPNFHQIRKMCCIQGCTRRELARFC